MRLLPVLLCGFALPLALAVPASGSAPYASAPPLAHTGGFGEPTCRACHFDNPLNDTGGEVRISGLPQRYEPGARYALTISLRRTGMQRAGFQLATRYLDGARQGSQAGELVGAGDRVAVRSSPPGVRYAHHSVPGTQLSGADSAAWIVEWQAPQSGGAVVVHLSGNAANGDGSEFGDWIYAVEREVRAEK